VLLACSGFLTVMFKAILACGIVRSSRSWVSGVRC
jgi:hypothetical protein